jgi:predicted sulfurtransferase
MRLNIVEHDDHSFFEIDGKVRDKIVADGLNETLMYQHRSAFKAKEFNETNQTPL